MFDYVQKIKEFLAENFEPSTPEESNFKNTSAELLEFIFETFPNGCITDYDLNEIMISLGYKHQTYVVEHSVEFVNKDGNNDFQIVKTIRNGWCLLSKK
jgi:Ca2+-binding EF-hand superfamily protein